LFNSNSCDTPVTLLHIYEANQTFWTLQPLVFACFTLSTTFDIASRIRPTLVVANIVSTACERAIYQLHPPLCLGSLFQLLVFLSKLFGTGYRLDWWVMSAARMD
jgi:hypothetical protein